jgi:hypothetical protein
MPTYFRTIIALGFTAAIASAPAFSQNLYIKIDEFGAGTVNGSTLPGSVATEPISGMSTMRYTLPFFGVSGDVQLFEPPTASGVASDVIRFDGNYGVYFFSDVSTGDPADSPADVGLPSILQSPLMSLGETGPEGGPNGYIGYTPGYSDPGANTTGTVTYDFISEVPEPGSLGVLACCVAMCGLGRRRRKPSRA